MNKVETAVLIWNVICRPLNEKKIVNVKIFSWSPGISLLTRKFQAFGTRKDDSIYKERRLVQRSLTNPNGVLLSLKTKRPQTKKPLKDKAILPPSKNPPKHCLQCCVTKVIVLCKGGEESKSERTINKSWEENATLCAGRFVVGFCCIYFNRVLPITNMKTLVSGFRQIPLR